MARSEIQRFKSGKHLLQTFTDNPDLPAFIPTLPSTGLRALIERVGVEDAGTLIEYATPKQFAEVLDDAVWTNAMPGTPEEFDPGEFIRWAEVILDIGDEFAVDRLSALDEDLLLTAMSYFLDVNDKSLEIEDTLDLHRRATHSPSTAECSAMYGRFTVFPRYDDEWDVLFPMLNALYDHEPDMLQALFTRCFMPASLLEGRQGDTAELDAAYNRGARKEQSGFVSPERAALFLDSSRDTELANLMTATEYDLDTSDYFRRIARPVNQERNRDDRLRIGHQDADEADEIEHQADPENIKALEIAVAAIELEENTPREALPAGAVKPRNRLQMTMDTLAEESPEKLSKRMAEAAYLSNILIAGCAISDRRFGKQEAADAVFATCNLGLEFAPDFPLVEEPGLVGLFRIGWHVLQEIPMQVIRHACDVFQRGDIRQRLGLRAWMLTDLCNALQSPQTRADVELRQYEKIHDTMKMLKLVMDDHACLQLHFLVDCCPSLSESKMTEARRFIESKADLIEIQHFLDSLPETIRAKPFKKRQGRRKSEE